MKHIHSCLLIVLAACACAAVQGPASKPRENLPTDRVRRHVQAVTAPARDYLVPFRGTVDGVMTRMPISYAAYHQGWQPNLYCRIENVGETDVINPWLTANGLGDWRTLQKIADEATRGLTTDAEKARAIWEWERKHRYHACTWDGECDDAVKVHNVYGYTLCGDDAIIIDDMFRAAGLKTRPGRPVGHGVTEAFYDGAWHLLDGDEHVICLLRDNKTVAAEADVVRDHDLMKRTHTYSIGSGDSQLTDQFSASLYGYEGDRTGERRLSTKHTMNLTLRPGESLEWRWDHVGKEYTGGSEPEPGKPHVDGVGSLREWGGDAYANMRNGKWLYRVPLGKALWQKGAVSVENVGPPPGPLPALASERMGEGGNGCQPTDAAKPAVAVWKLASPWVFVGAQVRSHYVLGEGGLVRFSFSPDGKTWQAIHEDTKPGAGYAMPSFDKLISPRARPMVQFFVKLELQGAGSSVSDLLFDSDVQMSLLGMPELAAGDNRLRYTDETVGARQVRVTHAWLERTAWQPPTAPAAPLFPADGATVEGTQVTFRWRSATAWGASSSSPRTGEAGASPLRETGEAGASPPRGTGEAGASPLRETGIADYHIEVCDRADMRWVISPNFEKLISRTPSKGKAEWQVPFVGLLNPGTTYYWRVRAMDGNGVWGPWSRRWSFKCEAPGVPLGLALDDQGILRWQTNPEGRKPVAYKVYGSDEQGFTASDTEYIVRVGRGFCDTMEQYNARAKRGDETFYGDMKTPPNFIVRTEVPALKVLKPDASLPNTNKAFYRVIAIDAQGNESGPSDYVAAPRPFIFTTPPDSGRVGEAVRYAPQAIRSIGHYTCRTSYTDAFWHGEKLTWTLEQGPAWLKLQDGILTGTPTAAGRFEVTLKVTNNKQQSATQTFTMDVK